MGRNPLQGITMLHTRKAQTAEAQAAMAERNARRVEIVKRALGDKYAHHPINQVQRTDMQVLKTVRMTRKPDGSTLVEAFDQAGRMIR